MTDLRVARRYARALFEVALQQGQLQATADDLRNLRGIMRESDELRAFFYSPLIPRDRKRDRLREAFRERVQPHTMRLLELLVEKRREKMLDAVCEEFQKLQEAHQGIARAHIQSAPRSPKPNRTRSCKSSNKARAKRLSRLSR
jgi:F-type H+-transporting ATPase subunit delta